MRVGLRALTAALMLCVGSAAMSQELLLTLNPVETTVAPGDTAVFLGLLENNLGATAVFDGMDVALGGFDPADISILFGFDDLPDNESRSEDLFSVYVAPTLASGSYYGTVYLYYSHDGGGGTLEQNFRINVVNPVPEPSLLQLPALLGLAGVGWWRRTRRRGLDGDSNHSQAHCSDKERVR